MLCPEIGARPSKMPAFQGGNRGGTRAGLTLEMFQIEIAVMQNLFTSLERAVTEVGLFRE